jgi:tRNA (guanine-N7-)-methyltransferase
MDWASHYPGFVNPDASQTTLAGTRKLLKDVEVADIGCGFGGLLIGLAPVLPDTLMVGTVLYIWNIFHHRFFFFFFFAN